MVAASLPVEHLFSLEMTADMGEVYQIRSGPAGRRLIAAISGGTFKGPRLSGTVAAQTGADWVTIRPDKTLRIDVRVVLITDDDAVIYMYYGGIGREGQFRTAPYFETDAAKYSWLNNVQGVGIGTMGPNGPTYEIYALS